MSIPSLVGVVHLLPLPDSPRYAYTTNAIGTPPACPPPPVCGDGSGTGGTGGGLGFWQGNSASGRGSCATTGGETGGALVSGAILLAVLAVARLRRR